MAKKKYVILPGMFTSIPVDVNIEGLDLTKEVRAILNECGYPCDPCGDGCDQPNICDLISECAQGGGSTTFIGLTDTPGSFGTPNYLVRINAGGTALEFVDPGVIGGASTFLGLTDTPGAFTSAGQVPRINGANNALEFVSVDTILGDATILVDTFLGLTDTPGAYAGANQIVKVNGTNNGLEFDTVANILAGGSYLNLSDTPGAFAGAGQIAVINGTNNGMTFNTIDNILSGSGAILSASNGLTEASNNVKLGGTLTENTTITPSTFGLTIGGAGSLQSFGYTQTGALFGHPTPYWHGESTDGDATIDIEFDLFSTNLVRYFVRSVDTSLTETAELLIASDGTANLKVTNSGAGNTSQLLVVDSNALLRCETANADMNIEARDSYINISTSDGTNLAGIQIPYNVDGGEPGILFITKGVDESTVSVGQALVLKNVNGLADFGAYSEVAATVNGVDTVQLLPTTINTHVGTGRVERAIFTVNPLTTGSTNTFSLSTISPRLNGDGVPVWYNVKVTGSSIGQAGTARTSYMGEAITGANIEVGPIVNNAGTLEIGVTNNLAFSVEIVLVIEYVV